MLGRTKFSKGEWWACCIEATDTPPHYIFAGEKAIFGILCNDKTMPDYEPIEEEVIIGESRANAKLIAAAPLMFYQIVILAEETGYASLFNAINLATGKDYKYGTIEFDCLFKEAQEFLKQLNNQRII